ncbi:MAG: DMT family transporter, partial [Oscillospiraceae bacterium]|nr:DMT family transporter [Candidatus Equicaccousia limihippi]
MKKGAAFDKIKGIVFLFCCSIIWGTAFVFQDQIGSSLSPLAVNGIRMCLGAISLLPYLFIKKVKIRNPKIILGGVICGLVLTAAAFFQQYGISAYTPEEAAAGKAGFLTALYIILVPVITLFMGKKLKLPLVISILLALVGLYLICIKSSGSISPGDIFVIISSVCFAAHIMVVEHFVHYGDGVLLSVIQMLTVSAVSLTISFIFEHNDYSNITTVWFPLLFLGVFSSGIAYTFQILGQKYLAEPTVSTLIMSLECVFAALAGWVFTGERLSPKELLGC